MSSPAVRSAPIGRSACSLNEATTPIAPARSGRRRARRRGGTRCPWPPWSHHLLGPGGDHSHMVTVRRHLGGVKSPSGIREKAGHLRTLEAPGHEASKGESAGQPHLTELGALGQSYLPDKCPVAVIDREVHFIRVH